MVEMDISTLQTKRQAKKVWAFGLCHKKVWPPIKLQSRLAPDRRHSKGDHKLSAQGSEYCCKANEERECERQELERHSHEQESQEVTKDNSWWLTVLLSRSKTLHVRYAVLPCMARTSCGTSVSKLGPSFHSRNEARPRPISGWLVVRRPARSCGLRVHWSDETLFGSPPDRTEEKGEKAWLITCAQRGHVVIQNHVILC